MMLHLYILLRSQYTLNVCAQCFNQQGTKLEVRSALNAVEHCYSVSLEEGVVLIRNGRQSMHREPWQQLQKIWQTALFSACARFETDINTSLHCSSCETLLFTEFCTVGGC